MNPSQYEALKPGEEYTFKCFYLEKAGDKYKVKHQKRKGKLLHVSTRWKENRDNNGKLLSRELVGDTLSFVPNDNKIKWKNEKLNIYAVHITAGFFEVEK